MRTTKIFAITLIILQTAVSVVGQPVAKNFRTETKRLFMPAQENVRVRAPEIIGGRGWLNTDKPLSLAALKGKVVLLDFWTYGCINCIHIIPDLKKLEAKYPNELVVIGVHSAKFDNEKETENIRRIIMRYEIEHPVYNDADFKVWKSYGVRAWPTQVLIDPAGYVIGGVSGEGNYELIDQVIAKAIAESRKRGDLNETPLKLTLERAKVGDLPLAFPGKVLADSKSDRLFIADSNHNRIVITRLDGTLIETVGPGSSGAADGPFDKATFYRPQGMALDGDSLYVADTENHLIRLVDLKAKSVKTVAGTGQQTRDYFKQGPARSVALSSPWDLELIDRQLYIAMAGPHQIWKMDLNKQEVSTFAGSGREAREDGALLEAGFAQPSGITAIGKKLYIADSESNIIRVIDTATGRVETLVGGDLFEFGDVDGEGDEVRLQHPLGVVDHGEKILIADTYNHKVKELDPEKRSVKSFAGTGKPGQSNTAFYEPGGLSIANGQLYVADTNNHAIRVVDLKTRQASTLNLKGLQPPVASSTGNGAESGPAADETQLTSQRLTVNKDATLLVNATLPAGYHLNPSATHRFRAEVTAGDANLKLVSSATTSTEKLVEVKGKKDFTLPIRLTLKPSSAGAADLRVTLTLYYCREDNTGTCFIKTLAWSVPVEVIQGTGVIEIKLDAKLEAS